jgi:hypothetical protein
VDVNLRNVIGAQSNFTFAVSVGTNGSIALQPDNITALFTATPAYNGLASFAFFSTNTGTGNSFGPTTVSILISTTNANSAPVLAPISNAALIAGATLQFTNSATDLEAPPQTLTFSLLNAPPGASVNSSNGVFTWRPAIAQGNTTNNMSVVAADNGSPSLSATQSFTITVTVPAQPVVHVSSPKPLNLLINGDTGPDYTVQASTNLADWQNLFTTNSPLLPFSWSDPNAQTFTQRFYRVLLGP